MKHSDRSTTLLTLAASLVIGGAAWAAQDKAPAPVPQEGQEPAPESVPGKKEEPEVTFEDLWPDQQDPQADAQQEIAELFTKVERRLRLIDSMLLDASAGETSRLEELGSSAIDELLQDLPEQEKPKDSQSQGSKQCTGLAGSLGQSSSQGRQAIEEMDKIIQIAQSMPSNCQSGSPKESEKSGESPLDKPQGRRDKSQSPEKPKPEDGNPNQQQPQDPKDNKASEDDGSNEPAERTPGSETESPPRVTDQREHWGDLPVHVRDVFRAEGGPGMPAQYRDWIDAYYRRLNARSAD